MDSKTSFNSIIEQSIKDNWDKDALTDYLGATLQYHDVARKIEKLHILFENSGLKKGDKVLYVVETLLHGLLLSLQHSRMALWLYRFSMSLSQNRYTILLITQNQNSSL